MNFVNIKAAYIDGPLIIDELRNLEQKSNGRIEASKKLQIVRKIPFAFSVRFHYRTIQLKLVF